MKRALALSILIAVRGIAAEPTDPHLRNDTGQTIIRKLGPTNDISVVVVSRAGTSVLLDPRAPAAADLVAVTHEHQVEEHVVMRPKWRSYEVVKGLPGVVALRPGTVHLRDVTLTGVAASHHGGSIQSPPDYVIFLLEVDGLRIAYLPCLVQDHFTPEQRRALGEVDVVLTSAEDDRDGRSAVRSFALARELHPRVIVPLSHHDGSLEGALDEIEQQGGKVEQQPDPLVLDRRALAGAPERVVHLLATLPE